MGNCIAQSNVVTRKPHRCWGCAKLFPAGTSMERNVGTDMGKIFSTYYCKTCTDFMNKIPMADWPDGWGYGE